MADGKVKLQALRDELQALKQQGANGGFETQTVPAMAGNSLKARRQLKGKFDGRRRMGGGHSFIDSRQRCADRVAMRKEQG